MTSSEFRAWFAGLTKNYARGYSFSPRACDLVRDRVAQLNEVPTPYPVFLASFWPFPLERQCWWAWTLRPGRCAPAVKGLSVPEQRAYNLTIEDSARFYDLEAYGRYAAFYALGIADAERGTA